MAKNVMDTSVYATRYFANASNEYSSWVLWNWHILNYSKMTINIFISISGNMKGTLLNRYEFLLSIDNVTKERFWISLVTGLCHRQN